MHLCALSLRAGPAQNFGDPGQLDGLMSMMAVQRWSGGELFFFSQDWMILIFCPWTYVMVPRGERGRENEREIPGIQLDRWITSENYQLNRDSKNWVKMKWSSEFHQEKASSGHTNFCSSNALLFHFPNVPCSNQYEAIEHAATFMEGKTFPYPCPPLFS